MSAVQNGLKDVKDSMKETAEIVGYTIPPTNITSNLSAPNGISRRWANLQDKTIAAFTLVFIIPPTMIFNIIRFYTTGPSHPTWTLKDQLTIKALKCFLRAGIFFKLPGEDPLAAEIPASWVRKNFEHGVKMIPPIPEKLRIGWAVCDAVKPVEIPAFVVVPAKATPQRGTLWEKAQKGEKALLYFVGGAYVRGHSARMPTMWKTAEILNARVFAVNYRKSVYSENAFPACLLDAMAGWKYLTETLDFKPENIALMGDSAGGNLALALGRYLGDLKRAGMDHGLPGGMFLISPWADLTSSSKTCKTNTDSDFVSASGRVVDSHIRHFPDSVRSPYFSPSLPSPDGSPRFQHLSDTKVYIQTGTAEALYDEDLDLAKGMKDENVDVRLRELEGDVHVGFVLGRRAATHAATKDLPEWWVTIGEA